MENKKPKAVLAAKGTLFLDTRYGDVGVWGRGTLDGYGFVFAILSNLVIWR